MPYAANVYSVPPGTTATTLTPIDSSDYNAFVEDIEQAQNDVRPIVAGGTGVDSAIKGSSVNTASNHQALLKDLGGVNTVAGTGDAITVTAALSWTAYGTGDGQIGTGTRLTFKAGAANTTATTINVNSLGAKAIRKISGGSDVALVAGDILAGVRYEMIYDSAANSAAGAWILRAPSNPETGGRIKFPATQNASSDANTLDDYEEGTFSVTAAFTTPGTSSWSAVTGTGVYTKIGNRVDFAINFTGTPTIGTGSGNVNFSGFPFTFAASPGFQVFTAGGMNNQWTWPAGRTTVYGQGAAGASTIQLGSAGTGTGSSTFAASNMTTGNSHVVFIQGTAIVTA